MIFFAICLLNKYKKRIKLMDKKKLYESIMKNVAKEVKKALNESIPSLNGIRVVDGQRIIELLVDECDHIDGLYNEPTTSFDERLSLGNKQEKQVAGIISSILRKHYVDYRVIVEHTMPGHTPGTNAKSGDILIMDGPDVVLAIDLKVANYRYIDNPSYVGTCSRSSIERFAPYCDETNPDRYYMCVSADGSTVCFVDAITMSNINYTDSRAILNAAL